MKLTKPFSRLLSFLSGSFAAKGLWSINRVIFLSFFLLVPCFLFHTFVRVKIVELGFEKSRVQKDNQKLGQVNRQLKLRYSALISAENLQMTAGEKFELGPVRPSQIHERVVEVIDEEK